MVADIIIVFIALAFIALGVYRGFMRGILNFITTTVAIILSLLGARPILMLINSITNNTIERDGQLGILIMTAVGIFIAIKLIVMVLKFKISKIKDKSKTINHIDRMFGAVLGLFKFIITSCIVATFILILGNVFSGLRPWLFNNSIIALWIYDTALAIVLPLITAAGAAVLGVISG